MKTIIAVVLAVVAFVSALMFIRSWGLGWILATVYSCAGLYAMSIISNDSEPECKVTVIMDEEK